MKSVARNQSLTPAVALLPLDDDAAGFPGCERVSLTSEEMEDCDRHIEYWDADKEEAWELRDVSRYHERPSQRLAHLAAHIAAIRGSPIETFGTASLLVRDAEGRRHRILEADQILYLHPARSRSLGHAVEVAYDDLPDVVLEVDLTTDARRRKLGIYESWGFPEVWIEVPDERARSTLPSRPSGLTVYLLVDGRYEISPASSAFPGWAAEDIHDALNEWEWSTPTVRELTRLGQALGEETGTGPDDHPVLGAQRRESFERGERAGRREGLAEGRQEGRDEGRAEGREEGASTLAETLALLKSRQIGITGGILEARALIVATPLPYLQRAAMDCTDAEDFLRRIQRAA